MLTWRSGRGRDRSPKAPMASNAPAPPPHSRAMVRFWGGGTLTHRGMALALFTYAWLVCGCAKQTQETQVLVELRSALSTMALAQLKLLEISTVDAASGEIRASAQLRVGDGEGEHQWPLSFSVVPTPGGKSTRFILVVTAFDGDGVSRYQTRVVGDFVAGKVVRLPVVFYEACVDVLCENERAAGREVTCRDERGLCLPFMGEQIPEPPDAQVPEDGPDESAESSEGGVSELPEDDDDHQVACEAAKGLWASCHTDKDCESGQQCHFGTCATRCTSQAHDECPSECGLCYAEVAHSAGACHERCTMEDTAKACRRGQVCSPYGGGICVFPLDVCPEALTHNGYCDGPDGTKVCTHDPECPNTDCSPDSSYSTCDFDSQCGCDPGQDCKIAELLPPSYVSRCSPSGFKAEGDVCSRHEECAKGLWCPLGLCAPGCSPERSCQQGNCLLNMCVEPCDFEQDSGCGLGHCACMAATKGPTGELTCHPLATLCVALNPNSPCIGVALTNGVCDGPSGSRACYADEHDPDCQPKTDATEPTPTTDCDDEETRLVRDDYQTLTAQVPAAWRTTYGNGWMYGPFPSLPFPLGPGLNTSPNVEAWFEDNVTPGIFLGASVYLVELFDTAAVLERYAYQGCTPSVPAAIEVGLYSGHETEWDCGDFSWLLVALWPSSHDFIVHVQFKLMTTCNRDVFRRLLETIEVTEPAQWPEELRAQSASASDAPGEP